MIKKKKKIYKKSCNNKKNIEHKKIIAIMKSCVLLGVSELSVDGIKIKFSSAPSSEKKDPEKIDTTPKIDPQVEQQIPQDKGIYPEVGTPDKDAEFEREIEMIVSPSSFMRRVESGEVSLGGNNGLETGDEL